MPKSDYDLEHKILDLIEKSAGDQHREWLDQTRAATPRPKAPPAPRVKAPRAPPVAPPPAPPSFEDQMQALLNRAAKAEPQEE